VWDRGWETCPAGLRRGNMAHRVRKGKHALQG